GVWRKPARPRGPPGRRLRLRQASRARRARPLARPRGGDRRRRDPRRGRRRTVVVTPDPRTKDGRFFHRRSAHDRLAFSPRLSSVLCRPKRRFPMDATALRAMQAPLKERYKGHPKSAYIPLNATGTLDDAPMHCKVETG